MSGWPVTGACFATVAIFVSMLMLHLEARATATQVYAPVELYTPFPPGPFEVIGVACTSRTDGRLSHNDSP